MFIQITFLYLQDERTKQSIRIMNISNVLDGWENYLNKSEVIEEIAKSRAQHCSVCPHLKHGTLTAFIKDEIKEIQGCYCGICKCPTSAKIRSEKETCSDNPPKW